MTTPPTTRARRRVPWRRIWISGGILIQGAAAFKLSFGAQTLLAHASGIPAEDAWLYPFAVDAAIVTASLIVVWVAPEIVKQTKLKAYLYGAIGLWTTISVVGNAIHTTALPEDVVTVPLEIAIAVNTVPAVTLFLTIHIATTAPIYRSATPPAPPPRPRRHTAGPVETTSAPPRPRRTDDIPPPPLDELMRLADEERMSTAAIAEQVGRSKSWVADQIAKERKRRAENAA